MGILIIHAVHHSCLEHGVCTDFQGAQGGCGISREDGVAGAAAEHDDLACFQLSDCLIAAEGIGHLRHGGAGHNNSGHTLLAQSILDGNGVHHGCQHTDLVCIHAIHFAGGTAAPEIAAANHDADLCAKVIRCLDARADRSNGSFIKTGAFFAGKCFAGDFQKNTFILNCHIQTPPVFSGHSRRCRVFPNCTHIIFSLVFYNSLRPK